MTIDWDRISLPNMRVVACRRSHSDLNKVFTLYRPQALFYSLASVVWPEERKERVKIFSALETESKTHPQSNTGLRPYGDRISGS